MSSKLRKTKAWVSRWLIVGGCLIAQFVVTVGAPVWQKEPTARQTTERFPCENHHCGCHSSEHCWRECCCKTTAEKLRWAKENGVTPPAYVVAQYARETTHSCCSTHVEDGNEPAKASRSSCCSSHARKADSHAKRTHRKVDWVYGVQAQKCHGLAQWWLICSGMIVDEPAVLPGRDDVFCGTVASRWCEPPQFSSEPAVPPPRIS